MTLATHDPEVVSLSSGVTHETISKPDSGRVVALIRLTTVSLDRDVNAAMDSEVLPSALALMLALIYDRFTHLIVASARHESL